jgi:hypothetical protein
MPLETSPYREQRLRWPEGGQHILAQFTDEYVVVYQAYRPAIAEFAVAQQRFGGEFSFGRMSWIKPNFLWMMYRSGWGTKEGQEVTLALYVQRGAFEAILAQAVHSAYDPRFHESREAWSAAVSVSEVRLQWDPDHDPSGARESRRAVQLGLRGSALRSFATEWIIRVEDISGFVAKQRELLSASASELLTPTERVLPVGVAIGARVGVDHWLNSRGL